MSVCHCVAHSITGALVLQRHAIVSCSTAWFVRLPITNTRQHFISDTDLVVEGSVLSLLTFRAGTLEFWPTFSFSVDVSSYSVCIMCLECNLFPVKYWIFFPVCLPLDTCVLHVCLSVHFSFLVWSFFLLFLSRVSEMVWHFLFCVLVIFYVLCLWLRPYRLTDIFSFTSFC